MTNPLRKAPMLSLPLAVLLAFGGCGEGTGGDQDDQPTQVGAVAAAAPAGKSVESSPATDEPAKAGGIPTIKEVMGKLTKGPKSLTPLLAEELGEDSPPWETIQPQTREFAMLAADLGKSEPPKGHMDSWEKLTSSYAAWAADLDRAAQAKDADAALEAHGKLAGSCMSCHREHRVMGPGMGGPPGGGPPGGRPPGGGPRGFGPSGGGPPGGPPPPPPDGPERE